ncbi:MAG: phage antirepressor KilAC domain-containing protein [Schaalia turicensis]|nr:phage antirepressor KilAC domain-containing protein [Schaalia turicensis]
MSDLIPFQYEGSAVRTLVINGEPWFVLADLCKVLEIKRQPSAVAERIDDALRQTYPISDSMGRTQQAIIVSEAGMYEVVIRSDKPEAATFRRWITTEVLPSIRKRGGYLTPEAAEQALTDPDFIIRLATELKAERAQRAQLEAQVEADKPKVVFADAVAASHTTILIGDLAKLLKQNGVEIGAQRLFAHLRRDGYLINRKGADWNSPTQYAMELGLFTVKETAITHSDGHVSISKTTKVTGRGQRYFVERFLDGRLPKPFGEEAAA